MKALTLSPAAASDIEHIWDYSAANWGPDQADRYTDEIRDACRALAAGERRGRTVDAWPGYLKLSTGSHMIYFRDHDDRWEVIASSAPSRMSNGTSIVSRSSVSR